MKADATAFGKVILFGEHAVVYGSPAIAVGIDRGAWADAKPIAGTTSTLLVKGWDLSLDDAITADSPPLARALHDLLEVTRRRITVGALAIEAEADLPPGGGLGCSAALGVAVARAIDPTADPETISERVMAWERIFHGNPSGIDAAVSSLGGCVVFEKGAPIQRVRLTTPLHLCIGHTGHASSTKTMVEALAALRERRPEIVKKSFDGITSVVKNARLAIEAGDRRAIGQFLDMNQYLLAGLFLSTEELEHLCNTARSSGALGAKLTGAGGGGCVVALVEDRAKGDAVIAAWKSEGFENAFFTTVGADRPRAQIALTEVTP